MARSSSDFCLLCTNAPCTCNAKKMVSRKRATPKAVKDAVTDPVVTAAPVEMPSRPSAMDRMRARAAQAKADERYTKPKEVEPIREKLSPTDAATIAAVRVLANAFEIEPADLAPFKSYLDEEPTVYERASAWRLRRGEGAQQPETTAHGD